MRLDVAPGDGVRPTTDRVREAIFSSIQFRLEGKRVLDLFAGSGALGIEALSRGASHATFVERDPKAIRFLLGNLKRGGIEPVRGKLLRRDVLKGLTPPEPENRFDWLFMDPPYEKGLIAPVLSLFANPSWIREGGGIIVDHSRRDVIPEGVGWTLEDRRVYGNIAIGWLRLQT